MQIAILPTVTIKRCAVNDVRSVLDTLIDACPSDRLADTAGLLYGDRSAEIRVLRQLVSGLLSEPSRGDREPSEAMGICPAGEPVNRVTTWLARCGSLLR